MKPSKPQVSEINLQFITFIHNLPYSTKWAPFPSTYRQTETAFAIKGEIGQISFPNHSNRSVQICKVDLSPSEVLIYVMRFDLIPSEVSISVMIFSLQTTKTINLKNTFNPSSRTQRRAYVHSKNHRNKVFTMDLRSFLQIETGERVQHELRSVSGDSNTIPM